MKTISSRIGSLILYLGLLSIVHAGVLVPYGSSGWRYRQVPQGALVGFEGEIEPAGFADGQAPFGSGGGCALSGTVQTPWSTDTDMLLRRELVLSNNLSGLEVAVAIDNDVQVWINGVDISGGLQPSGGCAERDRFIFPIPDTLVHLGTNLVAVRAHDYGGEAFVDVQVNSGYVARQLVGARLFTDAGMTTPGLVASFVDRSLQNTTNAEDWRLTQMISGTRVDTNMSFPTRRWGSRSAVGITGGTDSLWENFSVQWDGFLQVTQAGQRFATASDNGSRMWIDINNNGVFEAEELLDNNWGRTGDLSGGERSGGLPEGIFRIRIQYYNVFGNCELHLVSSPFVPKQFVPTPANPRQTVKAIVLNFDPRVPSEGGRRLHEVFGWGNPHQMVTQFKRDLEFATGGGIEIQVVEFRDLDDFPAQVDGFRHTPDNWVSTYRAGGPWNGKSTDFGRMVKEQGLAKLVNSGAVDEIWCFGPPADIPLFGETWMAGPNAFYINGSTFNNVGFDRAIAGYGFNYERGVDCMLHNLGHRTEDSMARPYGGWQLNPPITPWDRYAANVLESPGSTAGVGTCEVPANASGHYDYGNTNVVLSTALDWANFPELTGAVTPVSATNWLFGPAADSQRDYFNWFWGMMPRNEGTNSDGRQANWFKYLWDFNSYQPGTGRFRQREAILSSSHYLAGSNHVFWIRYYAEAGVNSATLGNNNVRVTGPNGYNRAANLAQIIPSSDNRHITARYSIAASPAGWQDGNQGDYIVTLQSGQVFDSKGVAFAGGIVGSLQLLRYEPSAIDVLGFVAGGRAVVTCTPADIGSVDNLFDQDLSTLYRTSSSNPSTVQVKFTEAQTFRGFRFYAAGSDTPPANLLKIETADNEADFSGHTGSYRQLYSDAPTTNRTVTMLYLPSPVTAHIVRLTVTQLNGDGVIHHYDWTLLGPLSSDTNAPTASLTAENLTEAGGTGNNLNVTYSDSTLLDVSSLGTGDIIVMGPNGFYQTAVFADIDAWVNGATRSVRYWVLAPDGNWESSDNGIYTVILQGNQVYDLSGNSSTNVMALGAFSVNIPPPGRRPADDLTENNARLWLSGAEGASASTSNDTSRKTSGASSILFATDGGFDTWLRFPPAFEADWDLSTASILHFDIFAENTNSPQFQENSPWIRLRDVNGNYLEYRYYEDGNRSDPLNGAIGQWATFNVPLRASDTTITGWRRIVVGTPALNHIASVEFHADTWGAGFRFCWIEWALTTWH